MQIISKQKKDKLLFRSWTVPATKIVSIKLALKEVALFTATVIARERKKNLANQYGRGLKMVRVKGTKFNGS